MAGQPPQVSAILETAGHRLYAARTALEQFIASHDPRQKTVALQNVVIWGRNLTWALQRLRGIVEDFDAWYAPWRIEMAQDPLLRYFHELRNRIEKMGENPVAGFTHIKTLRLPEDLGPKPENAVGYFVGFGAGWRIRTEEGDIELLYVALPESMVASVLTFADLPPTHLGRPMQDRSGAAVSRLYLQYLDQLVSAAESHSWRLRGEA